MPRHESNSSLGSVGPSQEGLSLSFDPDTQDIENRRQIILNGFMQAYAVKSAKEAEACKRQISKVFQECNSRTDALERKATSKRDDALADVQASLDATEQSEMGEYMRMFEEVQQELEHKYQGIAHIADELQRAQQSTELQAARSMYEERPKMMVRWRRELVREHRNKQTSRSAQQQAVIDGAAVLEHYKAILGSTMEE
ncbi:hypothetical protein IE81DRAFT_322805 [Ceraceosorus guamensis]|uniref:Uncharacterized protein n=1 Tax=Ceraceosorus guamensis TaxID=1522189 RepID=A0A316W1X1_9BASI|nr:hypothetical protein IE81DRAFT_322805 [Ceraceosorus guamensis]PWN43088.1 hypothetical protein IE81DRAFT_322805 [Ceraceosorus guamensis]